jgi:DNA-binding IclR family transcriptional regulator
VIHSIMKAIDILSLFSTNEPRLTLTEISQRLDLPKSTAHNILATLVAGGFIERAENEQYALGTSVIVLAQSARVNVEIRDRAAPLLRQLADLSNESTYLTVREQDHVLYIYAVESPRRLLARTAVGDRVPMYCTSVGKAILAYLDKSEVAEIVERTGLKPFTPNTLTELEKLLEDLSLTRQRGYALDRSEHELNVYCVGAPIFGSDGQVFGACSVSGIDPEILHSRLPELSNQVILTAQDISRRMGYVPTKLSQLMALPF